MAHFIHVEGVNRITEKLDVLNQKHGIDSKPSYSVSYNALNSQGKNYAIFVHEGVHMNFKNGQAKFLEEPARTHREELKAIVRSHTARTGSLRVGLFMASKRLLALSRKLVPVKTGALKESGRVIRET